MINKSKAQIVLVWISMDRKEKSCDIRALYTLCIFVVNCRCFKLRVIFGRNNSQCCRCDWSFYLLRHLHQRSEISIFWVKIAREKRDTRVLTITLFDSAQSKVLSTEKLKLMFNTRSIAVHFYGMTLSGKWVKLVKSKVIFVRPTHKINFSALRFLPRKIIIGVRELWGESKVNRICYLGPRNRKRIRFFVSIHYVTFLLFVTVSNLSCYTTSAFIRPSSNFLWPSEELDSSRHEGRI